MREGESKRGRGGVKGGGGGGGGGGGEKEGERERERERGMEGSIITALSRDSIAIIFIERSLKPLATQTGFLKQF